MLSKKIDLNLYLMNLQKVRRCKDSLRVIICLPIALEKFNRMLMSMRTMELNNGKEKPLIVQMNFDLFIILMYYQNDFWSVLDCQ